MKYFVLFLLPLVLSGCLTSNSLTPTYYLLHPQAIEKTNKRTKPVSVIIERPSVVSGLNSDRIVLLKNNGRELDYFAGARWNGQLDKIVQDFVIESFENSYDIVDADTSNRHQKADYLISIKIRDFQAEYNEDINAPPTIKVTIVCSTLKLPEKKSVNRVIKTHEQTLEANSMAAIVDGFEGLLQQAVQELLSDMP